MWQAQEVSSEEGLRVRLTEAELETLDIALEFEGYGTARNDLRDLLRERAQEAREQLVSDR